MLSKDQRGINYRTHTTRYSDSSFYDEVCTVCGAKDYTLGEDELSTKSCRDRLSGIEPEEPVDLYLEAHVTIEPVFDERRAEAAEIAKLYNFKLAHLLMKKDREATEERSDRDTFMTGHSKFKSDINQRTKELVKHLKQEGFKVWRYKVEDTLLDSKFKDIWELL